jgi:prepilin-type N-terminal cleavage/methylation domain-containing protein
MNRSRTAGFTLIELLIVVGIIGVLAAALLPALLESKETANITADKAHLEKIFSWLEVYRQRAGHKPIVGGHKFLLDPWVKGYIDLSPDNMATYFTPGIDDPRQVELKQKLDRGEKIWTNLDQLSYQDTHYAGRATEALRGNIDSGLEAWAADDNNEGMLWAFPQSATTNVLYGNGHARDISLQTLMESFSWPGKDQVLKSFGPDAGHPDLKKLDH